VAIYKYRQTLTDLRTSYVPKNPAQDTCGQRSTCSPNSNTPELDMPQLDRPAALLSPNSILPSSSSHSASIPARKYSEERFLKLSLF